MKSDREETLKKVASGEISVEEAKRLLGWVKNDEIAQRDDSEDDETMRFTDEEEDEDAWSDDDEGWDDDDDWDEEEDAEDRVNDDDDEAVINGEIDSKKQEKTSGGEGLGCGLVVLSVVLFIAGYHFASETCPMWQEADFSTFYSSDGEEIIGYSPEGYRDKKNPHQIALLGWALYIAGAWVGILGVARLFEASQSHSGASVEYRDPGDWQDMGGS